MGLLQRIACGKASDRKEEANRLIKTNLDARIVEDWQSSMEAEIASKSASVGVDLSKYRWDDDLNDWVIED